jgi:hypothetical protein
MHIIRSRKKPYKYPLSILQYCPNCRTQKQVAKRSGCRRFPLTGRQDTFQGVRGKKKAPRSRNSQRLHAAFRDAAINTGAMSPPCPPPVSLPDLSISGREVPTAPGRARPEQKGRATATGDWPETALQ